MQSFLYLQVDYCYNVDYVSVFIFVKCLCFRTVGNPDHLVFFIRFYTKKGKKEAKNNWKNSFTKTYKLLTNKQKKVNSIIKQMKTHTHTVSFQKNYFGVGFGLSVV